jgi:hypothetical protein
MFEEDSTTPVHPMPEVLKLAHKPKELPHYTPCKHFIPDEHTEKSARAAREMYSSVLREVTTNREKHIFRGVLNLEDRTVFCESRKAKGNAFHNMGVQSSSGFRFQPEEALIQFEYGVLEIFLSDESEVPLCMQDLYDIMLPWISLEFYQSYCHLVRLGYIVSRASQHIPSLHFTTEREDSPELMTSSNGRQFSVHRVLTVRKPLSTQADFLVAVLQNSRTFPALMNILDVILDVKRTSVKIATVTDGKVYFYSLAMIDFPDASEIS